MVNINAQIKKDLERILNDLKEDYIIQATAIGLDSEYKPTVVDPYGIIERKTVEIAIKEGYVKDEEEYAALKPSDAHFYEVNNISAALQNEVNYGAYVNDIENLKDFLKNIENSAIQFKNYATYNLTRVSYHVQKLRYHDLLAGTNIIENKEDYKLENLDIKFINTLKTIIERSLEAIANYEAKQVLAKVLSQALETPYLEKSKEKPYPLDEARETTKNELTELIELAKDKGIYDNFRELEQVANLIEKKEIAHDLFKEIVQEIKLNIDNTNKFTVTVIDSYSKILDIMTEKISTRK